MINQESAFEQISFLVKDFKENESKFLSTDYSEADVRKDFIDKFFHALGWDIYHNEQKNPYEQEVKIEKGVYVGRVQKRADYAFYLAPNFREVKFYIEAKKPSRNLSNADDYFQSCRYGWNAGTQITFLFDFEELHILDCRTRPDIASILNNKIKKYHYSEYTNQEKFAEIYWLLSREAVANSSLDKFADSLPKPKGKAVQKGLFKGGYQSIDEAFLIELDEIRDALAKSFKKANPHLESEQLTEMTQRTIDRLVFIRFLEDKQIEPDHYVSEFGDSKNAWKDFRIACRKLDAKYNGVVFKKHFVDSDNFVEPDDKSFSQICEELAHVNSPYNFDIIPIHILGSIYERFLGKVVIATDKRVRIEEKPEVRKAGGVYYTPQYIVNYIVDNTVSKLIDGKTPNEISKLRFADISCGSGSFLINVFDRLLEYHRKWYQENPEQAKKDGCYLQDEKWILSLKQKQKILTNNIYGVDLDSQAVEVTQLSLYLKLLEDETTATAQDTWVMFKEQLLPNLNNNIICGNSLIGTDILEGNLFNREDELKLKPMNFEDAFSEVMKKGGFDAIVGNPPYVRQEMLGEIKEYLSSKYEVFHKSSDLYTYFIEKGIKSIKKDGFFSFIVANKWFRSSYGTTLRRWIKGFQIKELIDFGDLPVFKGIVTYPCILVVQKKNYDEPIKTVNVTVLDKNTLNDYVKKNSFLIDQDKLDDKGWSLINRTEVSLIAKIKDNKACLHNYVNDKIFYGIKTGLNEAFIIDQEKRNYIINNNAQSKILIKPFLAGRDIKRYESPLVNKYLILIPKGWTNKNSNQKDKWKWFEQNHPQIANHLIQFGTKAKERYDQGDFWWEMRACDYYDEFEKPKLMLPDISIRGNFIYDEENKFCINTCYIIPSNDKYLLGILNSSLTTYYYSKISASYRGGYLRFIYQYIAEIPIRVINLENEAEKKIHEQMIKFVDEIMLSKKMMYDSKTESEKEYLEKKCSALDRQIDSLVYELYGLTDEEIKIIESINN